MSKEMIYDAYYSITSRKQFINIVTRAMDKDAREVYRETLVYEAFNTKCDSSEKWKSLSQTDRKRRFIKLYKQLNRRNYHLLLEQWAALSLDLFNEDLGKYLSCCLLLDAREVGLLKLIKHLSGYFEELVRNDAPGSIHRCCNKFSDVLTERGLFKIISLGILQSSSQVTAIEWTRRIADFTRFGKRFSITLPHDIKRHEKKVWDTFLEREEINKSMNSSKDKLLSYFLYRLRDVSEELFGDTLRVDLNIVNCVDLIDTTILRIPNGTDFDHSSTNAEKIHHIYEDLPWLREQPCAAFPRKELKHQFNGLRPCEFRVVPKNWKTDRGIAIQPASIYAGFFNSCDILIKQLERRGVHINDQSYNWDHLGCVMQEWPVTTIDSSRASDSMWLHLVEACIPKWFLEFAQQLRAEVIVYNSQIHKLEMWATMGELDTFPIESMVYRCILQLAYELFQAFEPERFIDMQKRHDKLVSRFRKCDFNGHRYQMVNVYYALIHVYGDDCQVPDDLFPYVEFLFNLFGLEMNREKTFTGLQYLLNGDRIIYRESCGKETFGGSLTQPLYFPRGGYDENTILTVSQLIQLQHELQLFPNLRKVVEGEIGAYTSEMGFQTTISYDHSGIMDIWSFPGRSSLRISCGNPLVNEAYTRGIWPIDLDLLNKITENRSVNNAHTVIKSQIKQVSYSYASAASAYCLTQYLQHGPLYATPLDRLLRVSTPRASVLQLCTTQMDYSFGYEWEI